MASGTPHSRWLGGWCRGCLLKGLFLRGGGGLLVCGGAGSESVGDFVGVVGAVVGVFGEELGDEVVEVLGDVGAGVAYGGGWGE